MTTVYGVTHRPSGRRIAGLLLSGACLLLSTAQAEDKKPNDPWERLNRATYAFNQALDRMLAKPAAKAYKAITPEPVRGAVANFVANLDYPTVIVNDVLELKPIQFGSDTARFVVNSTVGLGGLMDPASHIGLPSHHMDFGQTLGYWGVPAGPFLMLPVLGPSDLRDAPGEVVDRYTSIPHHLKHKTEDYGVTALSLLARRAELLATDDALDSAYDPYALLRDSYVARRNYLTHDGNVPEDSYDDPVPELAPDSVPSQ
jgi:phospholipid-binding lipoprotein MlaA